MVCFVCVIVGVGNKKVCMRWVFLGMWDGLFGSGGYVVDGSFYVVIGVGISVFGWYCVFVV